MIINQINCFETQVTIIANGVHVWRFNDVFVISVWSAIYRAIKIFMTQFLSWELVVVINAFNDEAFVIVSDVGAFNLRES